MDQNNDLSIMQLKFNLFIIGDILFFESNAIYSFITIKD